MTLDLDSFTLRCSPKTGAERAMVIGGVGSGKSTLADYLGADFTARYRKSKRLIVDTKPRYKADHTVQGFSAKGRYKKWGHGQPVTGSVLVEVPEDLELAWSLGHRIAIVQCNSFKREMFRVLAVIEAFFDSANAKTPSLVQFDEALDFFSLNGIPKGNTDVVVRCARAGRERGLGAIYCSQRTKGFPASMLEEINRLYLFRLDSTGDINRLTEFGAPVEEGDVPTEEYLFRYWTKADYQTLYGPYTLDLGDD